MISVQKVIEELDKFLSKNDYVSAEKHLLFWLNKADEEQNFQAKIPILNELIGLHRKLGNEESSLGYAKLAVDEINANRLQNKPVAATTYINTATAYKAFGRAAEGFKFFEQAKEIYERDLPDGDSRLGGLYNNMALSLVDLEEFERADELFDKAILVMEKAERGNLEMAITYLNKATLIEKKKGLYEGAAEIDELVSKAQQQLDISKQDTDGYYAFVCEKCATVFGYYGFFIYQNELSKRARDIYERH